MKKSAPNEILNAHPLVEAVIFDCDGVLVDSMLGHTEVEFAVLKSLRVQVTPDMLLANAGKPFKALAMTCAANSGVVLPADFDAQLHRAKADYFSQNLKAMQGIHEALQMLDGVPMAVASGSPLPGVKHSLEVTDLGKYFRGDWVLSSDMVKQGKPAPDLFLLAAQQMNVPPERCLVVEDADSGIKAAVAAGMARVGFTGGAHCGTDHAKRLENAGAIEVFSDMATLPAIFRRLSLPKYAA